VTAPANTGVGARPLSRTVWTRERVIVALQRWDALFGEPPRAADLNPSSAKWSAQLWRVERYRAGDPVTGEPWPSLNAVKAPFDGSLNKAILAAGLVPARPGPKRRNVVNVARAEEGLRPDARVLLDGLRAEVRDLKAAVAVRERQLERSREALAVARAAGERVRARVRTERVKVVDERAVKAAEARAMRAEARLARDVAQAAALASAASAEARSAGKALARAERRLGVVRAEKLEWAARARKAERLLAEKPTEVEVVVEKVVERVMATPAPGLAEISAARLAEREALGRAVRAEREAAVAEAAYREVAAAVSGEARKLSRVEVKALLRAGPSGPVLVTNALKALGRARATNNPEALRAALRDLAAAAVTWCERL
jgi:hypothetical protein